MVEENSSGVQPTYGETPVQGQEQEQQPQLSESNNTDQDQPVQADGAQNNVSAAAAEETHEDTGSEPELDMSDYLSQGIHDYTTPQRGDVLEGTIVRIDRDGILVDINMKSEGIVPPYEVNNLGQEADKLNIGDEVLAYVLQPENQEGHVVLSLARARTERGWRTVQKQYEAGEIIEAEVIDHNKGGLIVNVEGVRGFVPISQVVGLRQDQNLSESELEQKLASMKGERIPLKILEINRRRNRLILSERAAVQERRASRKEQLLEELREGEIRHGRVSSICDFGAFIDLGGADGLVHISELSWGQVAHPSDVLKVGDEVDVYVMGVDREKKKIALSLRRAQPEPWTQVAEKYKIGDLVTGTVTKLASFGAFARVEDGVEGLIHVSELGEGRILHPRSVVQEGDTLQLRVIRVDAQRRRLGLSLRKVNEEAGIAPAEDEAQEQPQEQEQSQEDNQE